MTVLLDENISSGPWEQTSEVNSASDIAQQGLYNSLDSIPSPTSALNACSTNWKE